MGTRLKVFLIREKLRVPENAVAIRETLLLLSQGHLSMVPRHV